MEFLKTHLILGVILILSSSAEAAPAGLTLQGRLVKNDVAVTGAVQLAVQVTSPNAANCLLYEETHSLTLAASDDGSFSVKIGGGTRTVNDKGLTVVNVFSNRPTAITGLTCSGNMAVTSYTPAASDSRYVYISFVNGADTVAFSAPYVVQSVPYALEAERLSGKTATEFLQTTTETTQAKINDLLDPATQYTELLALLGGTSTRYMTTSNTGPTKLPVLSSPPVAPSVGQIWYEGGVLKYYAGAVDGTKTIGTSGGSVTSITAGTGLSGGTITTTGTIALQSGVATAGTYKSVTVDTYGRVTAGSNPTTTDDYGITDAVIKGGQAGALALGTSDANSLSLNTNNSARVTVLSDGKVGIGVTGPTYPLEVNGSIVGTRAFATTGTAAAPGHSFIGDTGSGLYMAAPASVGLSNNGTRVFSVWGGALEMGIPIQGSSTRSARFVNTTTSMTVPVFTFRDATTLGMGADAANGKLSFITSSTSRVAIDSTGNVGIGTSTPTALLDVQGGTASAATDGNSIKLVAQNAGTGDQSGGSIFLTPGTKSGTGTAGAVVVTGRVGIGKTTPTGALDVDGGTAASSANGTNITLTAQTAGTGNQDGGNIALFPGAATGTGNNGGVLVGAATVPYTLAANSLYAAGNIYSGGIIQSATGINMGTSSVKIVGNGTTSAADYLAFHTNSGERARLTANGYFGLGTTAPSVKFSTSNASITDKDNRSVNTSGMVWTGAGSGYIAGFYNNGGGATDNGVVIKAQGATTNVVLAVDQGAVQTGTNGSALLRVLGNGNVGIGVAIPTARLQVSTAAVTGDIASFVSTGAGGAGCTIAWNGTSCSSDIRFKENIVSIEGEDALNKLLTVNPVHYTWIKDKSHQPQTGFIAQELEKIFPEFVKTDAKGYKQVNYAHFVSVLTASIKGLHAKLTHVDERVQELELASKAKDEKIKDLEARLNKLEKLAESK